MPVRNKQFLAMDFWDRVFYDETTSVIERAYDARLRIAWRFTRALAVTQGRIDPSQSLDTLSPSEAKTPHQFTHLRLAAEPEYNLPLVPPDREKYPEPYKWFVEYLNTLYTRLDNNIFVPHIDDPISGIETLWGILDPNHAHKAYPSFEEITLYELAKVSQTVKMLVKQGYYPTEYYLRTVEHLTPKECAGLIALARKEARKAVEYDQEEQRAMMVLKLQDHQRRAKKAFNLREELQGMKQEALVIGLTKTQPSGFDDVFAKVVDMASTGEQPRQLQEQVPTHDQEGTTDEEESE